MHKFFSAFFTAETLGGLVMLLATGLALHAANSPLQASYHHFVMLSVDGMSLHQAVTEYLMPIFFLMIGIELKHEWTEGALITTQQRILPLIAAIGGVLIPAIFFLSTIQQATQFRDGWAIPTATDIAFSLCVLKLVTSRIPPSAKIFLLAVAICDDLAAILIIAFFFHHGLAWLPLFCAAVCVVMLYNFHLWKMLHPLPYLLVGGLLAVLLHAGGIHTTMAGVITGLYLPRRTAHAVMQWLYPLVTFAILPLFAFVSAGVSVTMSYAMLEQPLAMGILLGLCIGKPLGIISAVKLATQLRLARLPRGTSWPMLCGIAMLAGIGFTMSLLIGQLAFPNAPTALAIAARSVLIASTVSAIVGGVLLRLSTRKIISASEELQ